MSTLLNRSRIELVRGDLIKIDNTKRRLFKNNKERKKKVEKIKYYNYSKKDYIVRNYY